MPVKAHLIFFQDQARDAAREHEPKGVHPVADQQDRADRRQESGGPIDDGRPRQLQRALPGRAPLPMRRDLGAAADVLMSFLLVALMIGLGRLASMPPGRLAAWSACVILNVLGAGLGRFGASLRDLSLSEG